MFYRSWFYKISVSINFEILSELTTYTDACLTIKSDLIKRSRFLPIEIRLYIYMLKLFYPRLHMRYQFGGVAQIRTNLTLWNPYIAGLAVLYITSRATCHL